MGPVRQTQSRELLVLFMCVQFTVCTILHRADLIIFPLALQTIIIAPMMSIYGKGGGREGRRAKGWTAMQDTAM